MEENRSYYLPTDPFPNTTEELPLSSTDYSSREGQYPRALLHGAVVCLALISIIGVSGNLISILALAKCPRLRNATTAFIINLCVADLIFCSFSSPFHAVMYMSPSSKYADSAMCKIFPFVTYGNGVVSLMTVLAITVNRYICIVHPKWYSVVYRPYIIAAMIATLWMSIFFVLSLSLFKVWGTLGYRPETRTCDILLLNGKSPKKAIFFLLLGLPSVVFVFCYARIYWVVRETSRRIQVKCVPTASGEPSEEPGAYLNSSSHVKDLSKAQKQRKELKVLKVTMVIFACYVLCYFPVSLMKLLRKEGDLLSLNVIVFLLVYVANCTNPIIYVVMSDEYRKAYIDLFTCRGGSVFSSISYTTSSSS